MDKNTLKELIEATRNAEKIYHCKNCDGLTNPCYKNELFYCKNCIKDIKSPKKDQFKENLNHTRIVSLLNEIERKCSILYYGETAHSRKNAKGETDLHLACKSGDAFRVKSLLSLGANPDAKDNASWTPLHEAVRACKSSTHREGAELAVKLLIEAGCNIDPPGDGYVTPLQKALACGAPLNVAEILIKNGADVNATNYDGLSALDCCATEQLRNQLLELSKHVKTTPFEKSKQSIIYGDSKVVVLLKRSENPNISIMEVAARCRPFMEFTDTMSTSVTHVIVPENVVDIANMDVLIAILRNIPVVTYQWLESCAEDQKITTLWPYYVTGNEFFSIKVMDVLEENKKLLAPKLFDGLNIFVGALTDKEKQKYSTQIGSTNLNYADIVTLVREGGGHLLTREPNETTVASAVNAGCRPWHARNSGPGYDRCCYYIICDDKPRELMYNMNELRHVPANWLVQCIWNYRIVRMDELNKIT